MPKQADLFKRLGAKNIKSLTSLKSIAEKPIYQSKLYLQH